MYADGFRATLAVAASLTLGLFAVIIAGRLARIPWIVVGAYGIRLVTGLVPYRMHGLGDNDGATYDLKALGIITAWRGEGPMPNLSTGKEGWPYLLAQLYRTLGHVPAVGIIINCVAGALAVALVAHTTRLMGWEQAVIPAALIAALWPVSILWGGLLLREATCTLLLALALWAATLIRVGHPVAGIAVLCAAGWAMLYMRGGLAFLIVGALPALLVLGSMLGNMRPAAGVGVGLLIVVVWLVLLPNTSESLQEADYFDSQKQASVARQLDDGTTGFSAAGAPVGPSGFGGTLVRFPSVLIGPIPPFWRNFGLLAAGIDGLLWLGLFTAAGYAAFRARPKWAVLLCLGPPVLLDLYLAQISTNFGVVMRLRAMGMPFLAPASGVGAVLLMQAYHQRAGRREHRGRTAVPAPRPIPERPAPAPTAARLPAPLREA